MKILRWADLTVVPWSNGLGETREVARDDAGIVDSGGFNWRISIARIDSNAPFSPLPGVDRSLMALGTDGVTLAVGDDPPMHLARHDVLRFAGEDDVRPLDVAAPSLDLNVMTRRGSTMASLHLLHIDGGVSYAAVPGVTNAVVVLDGALSVACAEQAVRQYDTVLTCEEDVTLEGTAAAALIRVSVVPSAPGRQGRRAQPHQSEASRTVRTSGTPGR